MGTVKRIVNGVVQEVDDTQMVKTIENGVVVEKPFGDVKKKPSGLSVSSDGTLQSQKADVPAQGQKESGNIDLTKQPSVDNPYTGGKSTVWSMSIGTDKGEVLIPRVTPNGKVLSEQEAIDNYKQTGKHLGVFDSPDNANAYAEKLHNDYESGKIPTDNSQIKDPFQIAKDANELSQKKINLESGMRGMTVEDADAVKQSKEKVADLKTQGFDNDFVEAMKDFPDEAFNAHETSKETLANLYKANPEKFKQLTNEAKVKYTIQHSAAQNAFDNLPDDANRNYIANQTGIIEGNKYSGDRSLYTNNMDELYSVIQDKQDLIDKNITDLEQRKKLHNLVADTYASYINSKSEGFQDEYDNSPLKSTLDINQYAGLKTLQLFDPEKYKNYLSILNTPIDTKYYYTANTSREDVQPFVTSDSTLAAKNNGKVSEQTINQKIGQQKILSELNGIGLENEAKQIRSTQHDLEQAYKDAPDDETKYNIVTQFNDTNKRLTDLQNIQKQEDLKYPELAALKFDTQTKEGMQQAGQSILSREADRFGHSWSSGVDAVDNVLTSLFGSEKDKANLFRQRSGESEKYNTQTYLPENLRKKNSPFITQVSDNLKGKLKDILGDTKLSDATPEQLNKLHQTIADNQDQIKTITNPEAGKTKNFFSKATLIESSDFITDVGAFMSQVGVLKGIGTATKLAEAATLFKDGYQGSFDKSIAEGKSVDNAHSKAMLDGAVSSAMALFGSKYEDMQSALSGGKSRMAKQLAGLSEGAWNNLVQKNKSLASRLAGSLKNSAIETGKNALKFGGVAPILHDVAHNTFLSENKPVEDIINDAAGNTMDMLRGSLGFAALGTITGAMKYKASPMEKSAVWDLSDNPEIGKAKIDEAVTKGDLSPDEGEIRKKTIDNIYKLVKKVPTENDKGKPLNDNERQDYLYNLAIKEKANDTVKDLPEKQAEKHDIEAQVAMHRNAILLAQPTDKMLEARKSELEKSLIPETKEDGTKIEIPQKEIIAAKTEIQAIDDMMEEKSAKVADERAKDLVDKKEIDTKLSEPIEGLNEQGIPEGDNVPPTENVPATENSGEEVTSIKNEVTRARRNIFGLKEEEETLRKDFGTTWDEAKAKIDNGFDTQDLINELKKKPRAIGDVEDALLLHHQNTKEIELQKTNAQINEAADKGDKALMVEANVRRARLLDELQDVYDVNKAAGRETARGLSARRMMVDRKYSLVNMMSEIRATNEGKPLIPEQETEIEGLHKTIHETQAAFDDYVKNAEEQISKLQEKILDKPINNKKGAVAKLRDLADKLDESTKGKTFSFVVPITPQMISAGMRLVADAIDKGEDVVKAIKKAIDEIKKSHPNVDERKLNKELNNAVIDSGINSTAKEKKQAKDFSGLLTNRKALKLKADAQRAKDAFDIKIKKEEAKKRSTGAKVQDTFIKWQRAFKLSNPVTMAKLAMAGATRLGMTPIEDIAGGGLHYILPKSLTKGAIGEGGGLNVKETANAYKNGILEGMKDSWQIMKKGGGKSDLDVTFGNGVQLPPEAIDFFGQLHSATKAPFKRVIFERSLSKRLRRNIANGTDVSNPIVQSEIAIGAYKDANRAIFMQDNKITTGWQRMVHYFETVDKKTGKAPSKITATTLQWLIPFVKVPTNIASEIGTHIYGVPVGVSKIVYNTFTKGLEGLPADEKDAIIRNLKKGSLGLAALTLGYMNPHIFGGYYQDKEHRDKNDAKANSVKIFGTNIPAWLIESPIFQAMQIGATVRRVKDAKVKGGTKGIGEGVIAGALGLAEHVPMIDQPLRIFNAIKDPKERDWYVDELVKGTIEPALLQKVAEWTDTAEKRSPATLGQHLEMGIPGLREKVKEKGATHKKR